MPILKSNNQHVVNPLTDDVEKLRYGGGVGYIKPQEEEQRIANAVLQDRIDTKKTPLSRMTGLKTSVIYYHQKTTGRNDYVVNTANIGTLDINKLNFIKISDFIIICQGEMSTNTENTEMSVDINVDGELKVLPSTIKPLVNDHFIMFVGDKECLFRVTNVSKTTIETDASYLVSYTLVEDSLNEKRKELEICTTDKYNFVYSHVGTSFRTLFKEEEYVSLEKMEKMYKTMSRLYNELFYDKYKNTYLLEYDCAEIKDEYGNPLLESDYIEQPYIVALSNEEVKNGVKPKEPKMNNTDVWFGSFFYDRMLIEFITKTGLFTRVGRKIFRISQLQGDLDKWYSKTIFYAVEHQINKLLRFKYHLPSPVTRVTIASTLNLYGTVSLEPLVEKTQNGLELYPHDLINYIMWSGIPERSLNNVSINTYKDMIELMCEVIGMYVNKKENYIVDRLMLMYDKLDEFYSLSIKDQNTFYLFPILSYIIQKIMDRLSSSDFGIDIE